LFLSLKKEIEVMPNYIGIDLGTTFSAVATLDETGRPIIVHNRDGENITPSVVSFLEPNHSEVGETARKMLWIDSNTIGRFKRDMGTSKTFLAHGVEHTPTALSGLVLKKLKQDTIAAIKNIEEAVVTIPANFANDAREATMQAAKLAELNVKYIINEPTAAALYYAFKTGEEFSGKYAVYDLGGGTFDISIIDVSGQNVEVLATNGVSKLGGDDFDLVVQKLVGEKFKEETGEEMNLEDYTKNAAENEKKSLSKRDKCKVRVSPVNIEITRNEFEKAISSLIGQTEMLCETTIDEAKLSVDDIKGVFLVGGSTRIPCVRESVLKVFKKEPISSANVDEVVALGAALYAAYKSDRSGLNAVQKKAVGKIKVSEITGKCFGTISTREDEARKKRVTENSVIITKGQKIPISVTQEYATIDDGQTGVNCQVTESNAPETDPKFVKIIWDGVLEVPPGRPAGQQIDITFSYNDNQIMECSFLDVASGKKEDVSLDMASTSKAGGEDIEKFIVE
jgi:molecular chaperone DnaK